MFGLLLFLNFVPCVFSIDVRKCCPDGASLKVQNTSSECINDTGHRWIRRNLSYGLPVGCSFGSAVYSVSFHGARASCIDNLNGTSAIVALSCGNRSQDFTVPKVHFFRKCCPEGRAYDSVQQTCWGQTIDSPPNDILDILRLPGQSVIDYAHGVPKCGPYNLLTDHLVGLGQIWRSRSGSIHYTFGGRTYITNTEDICLDHTQDKAVLVVRACKDQTVACEKNTCVRKCCPEDYSYDSNKSCSLSRKPIQSLHVYKISNQSVTLAESRPLAYWYKLECPKYQMDLRSYYLSLNGSLHKKIQYNKAIFLKDRGQFCIEKFQSETREYESYVFFCFEDEPKLIETFEGVGMLLSSIFLLLTFFVYAVLPSLCNLHGKTLMSHIACLFSAYVSLSIIKLLIKELTDEACRILGYITLFSFTAAFFWLNIISFDIWWTFGSMRPIVNKKKRERRRFILYSAYAWTIPTVFTALAFMADNLESFPASQYKPGIGTQSCWFDLQGYGQIIFFTGPVGVLLCVNIVFFILTARHCAKVRNDLDKVGHTPIADNKFKSDKSRFSTTCKLFVAMGINWFLEFLSAAFLESKWLPQEIWYLSDMVNACQGLVIFWIFVMKRRVLEDLRRRMSDLLGCSKALGKQPSVSTLFSGNTTSTDLGPQHLMKKSASESRLSPLPLVKHNPVLNSHYKSHSTNKLLV